MGLSRWTYCINNENRSELISYSIHIPVRLLFFSFINYDIHLSMLVGSYVRTSIYICQRSIKREETAATELLPRPDLTFRQLRVYIQQIRVNKLYTLSVNVSVILYAPRHVVLPCTTPEHLKKVLLRQVCPNHISKYYCCYTQQTPDMEDIYLEHRHTDHSKWQSYLLDKNYVVKIIF